MSSRLRFLGSLLMAALAVSVAGAQSGSSSPSPSDSREAKPPAQNQQATPKKKHVYTDEDMLLLKRKGGVSVVGDGSASSSADDPARATGQAAKPQPAANPLRAPQADCLTYSWAASVETAVLQLNVPLDRSFWLMKSFGGSVCRSSLGALPPLVNAINGDYVLDDGSKVHLTANAVFGAMPKVDDLVAAGQSGKPYIFVWRGHPSLVERVEGIDRQGGGGHVISLSKITLIDPYLGTRAEFTDKDVPSQIDAALSISAQPK